MRTVNRGFEKRHVLRLVGLLLRHRVAVRLAGVNAAVLLAAVLGCSAPAQPAVAPATAAAPNASAAQAQTKALPDGALDAALTGYTYPYPVQHFHTTSQGLAVDVAYMVVDPVGPNPAPPPAVLLLHGKNFSGAYWQSTAEALIAEGYRVIIPDQVGFGKSSKLVDFQYSFQELARLTQALLTELGIEKVAVVGHSMGGMLATRFALLYPQRTTHLILVNPIGLEDWKRVVPYHSIDEWEAENLKATPENVRQYMEKSYFDGKWKPDYDALVTIQAGWTVGPDHALMAKVSALHYHMIFTQPVVHEFPDLRVPTLLVIGQRDRTAIGKAWVSPEVAETLGRYPELGRKTQAVIPHARLVELDDVGHVPQVERFDAWRNALIEFLKEGIRN